MARGDEKLEALPQNASPPPYDNRKFTDLVGLILLISGWICLTVVGGLSCDEGTPSRLFFPMDSQGRLCGYDESVSDKPKLYFITSELNGEYTMGACVESCPTNYVNATSFEDLVCLPGIIISQNYPVNQLIAEGYCQAQYATTEVFGYCVFDDPSMADLFDNYYSMGMLEEFAADIFNARNYIFGLCLAFSLILGFLFGVLARVQGIVCFMVWGSIFLISFSLLGMTAYMLKIARDWADEVPRSHKYYEINGLRGLGWTFFVLLIVFVCVVCFFRKRIQLALDVIGETRKAVKAIPLISCFPLVQVVGLVLFLIPWSTYVIFTAGISETTTYTRPSDNYQTMHAVWTKQIEYRGWYLFLCLLWTAEFIIAVGQIVLARCFAKWYFIRFNKHIGNIVVFDSLRMTLTHHLGTAAVGSVLIVPMKPLRCLVSELTRTKKNNHSPGKVMTCCTAWLENFLQFIHRDAYVQTALFGHNFWTGGKEARFLLQRNIAKIGSVGNLPDILTNAFQIFISFFSTFLTYCAMSSMISDQLHSLISPTILAFVLSYIIANMFVMINYMGMSTIFQCFCADAEIFNASYASEDLQGLFDSLGKKREGFKDAKISISKPISRRLSQAISNQTSENIEN